MIETHDLHIPALSCKYENNNLWLHLPNARPSLSMLTGYNAPYQAVITKAGRTQTQECDRKQLFEEIAQAYRFPRLKKANNGVEATIHTIDVNHFNPPKNWREKVIRWISNADQQIFAVEKKYKDPEGCRLLGPELIGLWDHLQPNIQEAGFQLIEPYGATSNSLYLPYIKGQSLYTFFQKLMGETDADIFKNAYYKLETEVTDPLRLAIRNGMESFLGSYGYTREQQFSYRFNYTDKTLAPLIACADAGGETWRHPFENIMMPSTFIPEISESIHYDTAQITVDKIKERAIILDPVIVRNFNPTRD